MAESQRFDAYRPTSIQLYLNSDHQLGLKTKNKQKLSVMPAEDSIYISTSATTYCGRKIRLGTYNNLSQVTLSFFKILEVQIPNVVVIWHELQYSCTVFHVLIKKNYSSKKKLEEWWQADLTLLTFLLVFLICVILLCILLKWFPQIYSWSFSQFKQTNKKIYF